MCINFTFCLANWSKKLCISKKNEQISSRLVYRLNSWWIILWTSKMQLFRAWSFPANSWPWLTYRLVSREDWFITIQHTYYVHTQTVKTGSLHAAWELVHITQTQISSSYLYQEYGHTYAILIFDADISSIFNEAYHCVVMAFCSCSVQGSPLIENTVRQ